MNGLGLLLVLLALSACNKQSANEPGAVGEVESTEEQSATADSGNSERGRRYFIQCQACHTLNEGGPSLVGPNLWGVLGRAAGKHEGFRYSDGLAQSDFTWTLEKLDEFLAEPNALIPGTTMIFIGMPDGSMRKDLLAYLIEQTTGD